MSGVKPYKIVIEWNGPEEFYFSCDYTTPETDAQEIKNPVNATRTFPVMVHAMGNVLRKLRKEHISFPLFLVALAFNHRNLLNEIDQLLTMLHRHIDNDSRPGTFSCYIAEK
jgi:hypothetical protein